MSTWCTIESDPGVLAELMTQIGVTGLDVDEVFSLDQQLDSATTFGLIFLFKVEEEAMRATASLASQPLPADVVPLFARQVVADACASYALLNILLNVPEDAAAAAGVALGPTLELLRGVCAGADPQVAGDVVASCDTVRLAHNSFARQTVFEHDGPRTGKKAAAYHFIAYAPVGGVACELDGMARGGPIGCPPCATDGGSWVASAMARVRQRVEAFSGAEIEFALLAVVADQLAPCRVGVLDAGERAALEDRRASRAAENVRRRHNYVPFCIHLLQTLAAQGELDALVRAARDAAAAHPDREEDAE